MPNSRELPLKEYSIKRFSEPEDGNPRVQIRSNDGGYIYWMIDEPLDSQQLDQIVNMMNHYYKIGFEDGQAQRTKAISEMLGITQSNN